MSTTRPARTAPKARPGRMLVLMAALAGAVLGGSGGAPAAHASHLYVHCDRPPLNMVECSSVNEPLATAEGVADFALDNYAYVPAAVPDVDIVMTRTREGRYGDYWSGWYCEVAYNTWCINNVRHTYDFHRATHQRDTNEPDHVVCQKLIRDSNGENYGSFTCANVTTSQSYAGNVLTKPLVKNSKQNDCANCGRSIRIYSYQEY